MIPKMTAFPTLPILETLTEKINPKFFQKPFSPQKTIVIGVQHLVETTGSLIQAIIDLGILPNNIFLLGKQYSSNTEVKFNLSKIGVYVHNSTLYHKSGNFMECIQGDITDLWKRASLQIKEIEAETVIIIDDGGFCLSLIPSDICRRLNVVGIEQTTSGIQRKNLFGNFPIIQVASSAVKTIIEPYFICDAILKKMSDINELRPNLIYGIIGIGNIGKVLANALLSRGFSTLVFDRLKSAMESFPKEIRCEKIDQIFCNSDSIIGCTGEDLSKYGEWVDKISGTKTLMSCSSSDTEFKGLLQSIETEKKHGNPYDNIIYKIPKKNVVLRIIRGGFPVNFDQSKESVPATNIQLTRGLLFSAFCQAIIDRDLFEGDRNIMLNPFLQAIIVKKWIEKNKNVQICKKVTQNFENIDFIINNSKGIYKKSYINSSFV